MWRGLNPRGRESGLMDDALMPGCPDVPSAPGRRWRCLGTIPYTRYAYHGVRTHTCTQMMHDDLYHRQEYSLRAPPVTLSLLPLHAHALHEQQRRVAAAPLLLDNLVLAAAACSTANKGNGSDRGFIKLARAFGVGAGTRSAPAQGACVGSHGSLQRARLQGREAHCPQEGVLPCLRCSAASVSWMRLSALCAPERRSPASTALHCRP